MIRLAIKLSILVLFSFIVEAEAQLSTLDSAYFKRLDTAKNIFRSEPKKALKISDEIIKISKANESELNYSLARALSIKSIIYNDINVDTAYYLNRKSLEVSKKYDNWDQYYKTLSNIAGNHAENGNYLLADSLFMDVIYHPKIKHDPATLIIYYLKYSSLKNRMNNTTMAIDLLQKAIDISEKEGISKYNNVILNRLANFYSEMGDNRKSLNSHKAILPFIDSTNYRKYIIYNNIANQHLALNELDSATYYLEKVLDGKPKESSLIYTYQHMATVAKRKGRYEESFKWGQQCIDLSNKWNKPLTACMCRFINAKNLNALEQFVEAKKILKEIQSCMKTKTLNLQIQFEEMLLSNELLLTDRKDLNEVLLQVLTMKDSIGSTNSSSKFRELETKYQTQKKEAENQLLKKDNDLAQAQITKQRAFLGGTGVAILSLLGLLWSFFSRSKEKQKNILALTEKNEDIQALNQEIAHRTKNHLALATALLSKDRTTTKDPLVKSTLADNENRLRTLTLVNQKLNQTVADKTLNLNEYLQELCDDLMFSLEKTRSSLLQLHCENLKLDSEIVLRLGLITNELITNSFKHAQPHGEELKIAIDISEHNHTLNYHYTDNGKEKGAESNSSQGMSLLGNMWDQLQGDYEQTFSPHYQLSGSIGL